MKPILEKLDRISRLRERIDEVDLNIQRVTTTSTLNVESSACRFLSLSAPEEDFAAFKNAVIQVLTTKRARLWQQLGEELKAAAGMLVI